MIWQILLLLAIGIPGLMNGVPAAVDVSVDQDIVIGIELGNEKCRVAVYGDEKVEIISIDKNSKSIPSYVTVTENGYLVGAEAKSQAGLYPNSTTYGIKRLIGRKYEEEEVQALVKIAPYKILNDTGKAAIQIKVSGREKVISPEELTSRLLMKLKMSAEEFLGHPVESAVIPVPVYFNDDQRQAIKIASSMAGFEFVRIINEPTATALAYSLDEMCSEKNIVVFDLGTNRVDVAVLNEDDELFEVLAISEDLHLGGENFTARIVKYIAKVLEGEHRISVCSDIRAIERLRQECELAKEAFYFSPEVDINVTNIIGNGNLVVSLTRAKFEEINNDLFESLLQPIQKALEDAFLTKGQIDEILLVGSNTRMPKVQHMIERYFKGKSPRISIDPEEAIVYGAARQGCMISKIDEYFQIPYFDMPPVCMTVRRLKTCKSEEMGSFICQTAQTLCKVEEKLRDWTDRYACRKIVGVHDVRSKKVCRL